MVMQFIVHWSFALLFQKHEQFFLNAFCYKEKNLYCFVQRPKEFAGFQPCEKYFRCLFVDLVRKRCSKYWQACKKIPNMWSFALTFTCLNHSVLRTKNSWSILFCDSNGIILLYCPTKLLFDLSQILLKAFKLNRLGREVVEHWIETLPASF